MLRHPRMVHRDAAVNLRLLVVISQKKVAQQPVLIKSNFLLNLVFGPLQQCGGLFLFPVLRIDDNCYRPVIDKLNHHHGSEYTGLDFPA